MIEFLAPDRQIVTVPVRNLRTVAADIPEQRRQILLAVTRAHRDARAYRHEPDGCPWGAELRDRGAPTRLNDARGAV